MTAVDVDRLSSCATAEPQGRSLCLHCGANFPTWFEFRQHRTAALAALLEETRRVEVEKIADYLEAQSQGYGDYDRHWALVDAANDVRGNKHHREEST